MKGAPVERPQHDESICLVSRCSVGVSSELTMSLVSHHEIDVLFQRCQNGVDVVNRVIGVESDA